MIWRPSRRACRRRRGKIPDISRRRINDAGPPHASGPRVAWAGRRNRVAGGAVLTRGRRTAVQRAHLLRWVGRDPANSIVYLPRSAAEEQPPLPEAGVGPGTRLLGYQRRSSRYRRRSGAETDQDFGTILPTLKAAADQPWPSPTTVTRECGRRKAARIPRRRPPGDGRRTGDREREPAPRWVRREQTRRSAPPPP